ncbi:hypothetical protein NQ176_g1577 [Zarea fungicola]|uniref:Uncharacterized protein n=1 Tax=Zarea fungicola TaxID=93591 RepID=A0ACC1NUC3_9HYPO|nr:hypothetical protein NQ176_g1577 [Lecanicillium fungicola]
MIRVQCVRLQLQCPGYVSRIIFKDQTDFLTQKHGKSDHTIVSSKSGDSRVVQAPVAPAAPAPAPAQGSVAGAVLNSRNHIQPLTGNSSTTNNSDNRVHDPAPVIDAENQQHIAYEAPSLISGNQSLEQSSSLGNRGLVDQASRTREPGVSPADFSGNIDHIIPDAILNPDHDGNNPLIQGESRCSVAGSHITTSPQANILQQGSPNNVGISTPLSIAPVAPLGLLQSARFPEDIVYYHHLRDGPTNGILSILHLNDIFHAEYLDCGFFHAVLALSALDISKTNVSKSVAETAALHALDHFVTALGTVRIEGTSHPEFNVSPIAESAVAPKNITSRLATILFLALFELQRGQMQTWYVHSRAAVSFLAENLEQVRASVVGESLIRSFSRLVALLDIYDRTFSVHAILPTTDIAASFVNSLASSPHASDRLLAILPRVIELEEEWRSDPKNDLYWQEQAKSLIEELQKWRSGLEACDIPARDFEEIDQLQDDTDAGDLAFSPIYFPGSKEPTRAATNFIHYLVSLLRVRCRYSSNGTTLPANSNKVVSFICRLAAGVDPAACANIHAYGHGLLPALMNAYYLSDSEKTKRWIRNWIACFPREREGIWNVRHAQRLLAYVDGEYSRSGSRAGWTIIKVRMVNMDEECSPLNNDGEDIDPEKFSVEVYSRNERGWSIDFIEIP